VSRKLAAFGREGGVCGGKKVSHSQFLFKSIHPMQKSYPCNEVVGEGSSQF